MKKIFKIKFALIAIATCCSFSLISFKNNENLYGNSKTVCTTNNEVITTLKAGNAINTFSGVSTNKKTGSPIFVIMIGHATRSSNTLIKNEYAPTIKIEEFQKKMQENKFKNLD